MTVLNQFVEATPGRVRMTRYVRLLLASCTLMAFSGCVLKKGEASVRREAFLSSDGYKLVGDLYLPRSGNGIGIVLLHGSSPHGRSLHLYTELCAELQARDYVVFNLDVRGYGESEDPRQIDRLEDYNFAGDAVSAIEHARKCVPKEDVNAWFVVGHSMGGGLAVHAALRASDIKGVVSISPGRRIRERFFAPGGKEEIAYLQKRKSEDMRLTSQIPLELLEPMLMSYDIGVLNGARLPFPLLLIEGAREPAKDLAFSREWVTSQKGDVRHQVLDDAGHYFGTDVVEEEGVKRWQTTRPAVLGALISAVDEWLRAAAAGKRTD